jgi:hypothetical protein
MITPTVGSSPASRQRNDVSVTETTESRWNWLYKVGGAAALISAIFIPIQVIVFLTWPPPLEGTISDWFALFQQNKLAGLIDLDLLLVGDNILLIPILLALYVVLRRANESVMALATALGLVALVLFIASNPAFQMLSLSEQYAAATGDSQRSALLAAGQVMIATWQGTAFQTAYVLGSVSGIAIGVVMLRSGFGKVTGTMGILANAVGLGLYVPTIGVFIAVFSVVFLEVWYILVARRLFQPGRTSDERF